jgi:hypothetical protein
VNLRISALLYLFITFDDRVERSMLMHNEEKVSGQACAYVERWGPKSWKYGGEVLYFSSIILDSVW